MGLVQPDVQEKRPVAVPPDEVDGVGRALADLRRGPAGAPVEHRPLVDAVGLGRRRARGLAVGEVPLAEVPGAVAGRPQEARQRRRARIEPVGHPPRTVLARVREVLVHAPPRRILPGHHRRAARRADGVEDVELPEVDALRGQLVQVRRAEPRRAVGGEVAPAPVVGEDEDDVGARGRSRAAEGSRGEDEQQQAEEHRGERAFSAR